MTGEEQMADPYCDVEAIALLNIQINELRAALAKLSPEEYALIKAIFLENQSIRQYSAQSGLPRSTVLRHKARILEKIKHLIDP